MTHSTPGSLCGAATVFVVQDILRSVEHYRDVLGFHTVFTLSKRPSMLGSNETTCLQAASETKHQPGHGAVNIFVTDVDGLYEELKSRGAKLLKEPKNYAYGMRDFDVNDLDGNQLCFGMEWKQPQATS